jgi:protein gp37
VRCHPEKLDEPLKLRKPSKIFVNSMSDLFHPDVPPEFIDDVLAVIKACPQHTFLILTKRPENIQEKVYGALELPARILGGGDHFPPNVWLGVSVENQTTADERIPILLQTSAAHRFISVEPMLGEIDLTALNLGTNFEMSAIDGWYVTPGNDGYDEPIQHGDGEKLDWIICGGETGPGARPMHPDWAKFLRDQCVEAKVPFFFKKWGKAQLSFFPREIGKKMDGYINGVEWRQLPDGLA